MKRIWDSKMGTPSSARIIQDVNLALKALEIVYRANGAAVEGLADRSGHIRKLVGKGKSVRCEFALATLTFGPCTSTSDIFPFTYHFPPVPIYIS